MGTLYVVATPIGNLEDITYRALRILKEVDLIACEDTRRTGLLLQHFQLKKPLISYHQHSKIQKVDYLVSCLQSGQDIALLTDAGTPGIADPAGVLLAAALKSKIRVVPIPGPSAVTALLSVAGAPAERFIFLGYLPKKKGRQKFLTQIISSDLPIVFLESPHRIEYTLEELGKNLGEREVIVAREISKKFEEFLRGRIKEVIAQIHPKGEFIVFVSPKKE